LSATARTLARRWGKETVKLERALALLDQAPNGLGDERFPPGQVRALHGWPLCEALLRKSYEARFSDPKRMLKLAQSAATMAQSLSLEKYPWPGFLSDLRARAFTELGNAYRVNDHFPEADAAFGQAMEILQEEGIGDPLVHSRVLDLLASLRTAQRRLDQANSLLEEVYHLYIEAGEPHLAGRALISKGTNTFYQGNPREAVTLLRKGQGMLVPGRDPLLQSSTQLNIIDALAEAGEYRQASRRLLQSGLREAFAAEPLNLLKLRWVEGKVHAGLGRLGRAERAFREVREEYLVREQVYDAAIVGLELAAVWLRQGKVAPVRKLAEEMYEAFEDLGVRWEADKALYFLREACRQQLVTVSMVERLRTFLERLRWQPGVRFEPALFAP
jgi:tetratricopeptide (TPR) repeat protein